VVLKRGMAGRDTSYGSSVSTASALVLQLSRTVAATRPGADGRTRRSHKVRALRWIDVVLLSCAPV
jgi:hypothetical protein